MDEWTAAVDARVHDAIHRALHHATAGVREELTRRG
jgi:hypothetical protein